MPLSEYLLLVSGRGGFEIIQKAIVGGVPVVASVSAPSELAVRLAREMVARIDELFAIDADARRQGMDFAGRHALRLEKSVVWKRRDHC